MPRPKHTVRNAFLMLTDTRGNPVRPTLASRLVMLDYAWDMAELLQQKVPDFVAGMTLEKIVEGLLYCGVPHADGYEYARHLEGGGWSGFDADVIAVLHGADQVILKSLARVEAQWVHLHRIQPPVTNRAYVRVGHEFGLAHLTDAGRLQGRALFQPNGVPLQESKYIPYERIAAVS